MTKRRVPEKSIGNALFYVIRTILRDSSNTLVKPVMLTMTKKAAPAGSAGSGEE